MSDHLDNAQPGADPLADRLRALGADTSRTASLPSVDEIHRGGDRRRRTQRFATVGATLAVAAVVGGAVVASQLRGPVDDTLLPATPSPTASATPSPTPSAPEPTPSATSSAPSPSSPSATPSGSPTPSGSASDAEPYAGRRIDLGGRATVLVPAGWTSTARQRYIDQGDGISVPMLCLEDGVANGPSTACDIEVQWGPVTVGAEGNRAWEPGQPGGWYHRTDAAPCPLPGGDPTAYGKTDIMRTDQVPAKSFGPVGSKTAEVYRYAVDCTQGRSFTSTMWWLPTTQLRFHDVVGNDLTKDILGSVRFDGE